MFKTNRILSFVLILLFSSAGAIAQMDSEVVVTDEELEQFASAFMQIQLVNQQAQHEMIEVVQENGLTVDEFNEIQQAHQPDAVEIDVTADELESYEAANVQIGEIQQGAQILMQEKIMEEGLSVNRYQEIAFAIQNNMQLQEKLQQYLQ